MASFSSCQGVYGVTSSATFSSTNVFGAVQVGISPTALSLTMADTAYSVNILAATSASSALLTWATGICTTFSGSVVISDGDGKDVEGVPISTLTDIYGWLVKTGNNGGNLTISVADTSFGTKTTLGPNCLLQMLSASGIGADPSTTVNFIFENNGDSAQVVVIGS